MDTMIPDDYMPQKNCLRDKIILITGAAGGIGATVSRTFAHYGATVILLDKDVKGLESLSDEMEDAGDVQPALYPMNLEGAKDQDYADLASVIEKEFGRLDGLLHNAARRDPLTPLWRIQLEDWFEILQVNLNAPFMLTCACLDLLNAAQHPSVVFTTDHQSRRHHAYWGTYGISKHAVDGLMKTFADELENQSPIRVNAIDPGPVKTSMRVKTYPGLDPDTMTSPKDIMDSYVYLMDESSRNVNAQIIHAQTRI